MIRKICFDRILRNKIFNGDFNFKAVEDSFLKSKKLVSYNNKLRNFYFKKFSLITKNLVGQRIFVHTGKEIVSLKITPIMVGYKIGEFFFVKKAFNKFKK